MEFTTTISETGTLNLPKELLTSTGLKPGSNVSLSSFGEFWAIRPASPKNLKKRTSILDWEGAFKFDKTQKGPTDFDAIIQQVVLENDQC